MADITVRLYASLREAAGTDLMMAEADDILSLFAELSRTCGGALASELSRARMAPEMIVVLVNGRAARHESWSTRLADGDEVALFPPVSGG